MKIQKETFVFVLALSQLMAASAFATQESLSCRSLDREVSVAEGARCQTSQGAVYERVSREGFGEAWRDAAGLVWSDYLGDMELTDAAQACQRLGASLPSQDDYVKAELAGIREVLPNMDGGSFWSFRFFWTATSHSEWTGYVTVYNGEGGTFGYDPAQGGIFPVERAVRCVSNAGVQQ